MHSEPKADAPGADDATGEQGLGAVPRGKARRAEVHPRVFARVSPDMRAAIDTLAAEKRSPVDGTPSTTSEVVRQLVVTGYVLVSDQEFLAAAVALKAARNLATMDDAWRAIVRAGIDSLEADLRREKNAAR